MCCLPVNIALGGCVCCRSNNARCGRPSAPWQGEPATVLEAACARKCVVPTRNALCEEANQNMAILWWQDRTAAWQTLNVQVG
jgi:hypothetical protein